MSSPGYLSKVPLMSEVYSASVSSKVQGFPAEFADSLTVLDHRFLTVCVFVVFVILGKSIYDMLELYLGHADVFIMDKRAEIVVMHKEYTG